MPRGLSANEQTEVGRTTTDTLYLVELGFSTPVYYSSREQVSWDSHTWIEADLEISDPSGSNPSLTIFNENTTLGDTVISQGTAGRSVKIYQRYGTETPQLLFTGEMGESTITEFVDIKCRRAPTRMSPNLRVGPPNFNHVPRAGTRITTRKGIFILESR